MNQPTEPAETVKPPGPGQQPDPYEESPAVSPTPDEEKPAAKPNPYEEKPDPYEE
jgi:hypothetical protein